MEQLTEKSLGAFCREVAGDLRHLSISADAIESLASDLASESLPHPAWDHPAFPVTAGPTLDVVVWLGNALNFCYWVPEGESMWSISIAGQREVDAFALFGALNAAFEQGHDLGDAHVLRSDAISAMFASGRGYLPLVEDRIRILRDIGDILEHQFDGRLENAVEAAGKDAPGMASFLAATFPSFNDVRRMNGIEIPLYKRAQLAAGMLHAARKARGAEGLCKIEQLTVYADYMLPVALRSLGIMQFSKELEDRVNARRLLDADSREETEIRVATVAACDQLLEVTREKGGEIDALKLDFWLWRRGFDCESDLPHHRTLTTDY